MSNKQYYGKRRGMFFLIGVAIAGVAGFLVMTLWNAILPDLLDVKTINYWQAVGLFILCRILFGSFRGPGGRGRRGGLDRHHFREKFRNASPEEREALKEEWRRRCRH